MNTIDFNIEYINIAKVITRELMGNMSLEAFQVLLFVNDRTLRFNKESETIKYSQIQEGVFCASSGEVIINGTGLSKYKIIKAVHELSELGLVELQQLWHKAYRFTINIAGIKKMGSKFTKPKKNSVTREHGQKIKPRGQNIEPSLSNTENNNTEYAEQTQNTIKDKIKQVKERYFTPTKKINTKTISTERFKQAWQASYHKHYPELICSSPTQRDIGILKKTLSGAESALEDVLDYAVENWAALRLGQMEYFRKRYKMPETPDISFFVRFVKEFVKQKNNTEEVYNIHGHSKHSEAISARAPKQESDTPPVYRKPKPRNRLQELFNARKKQKEENRNENDFTMDIPDREDGYDSMDDLDDFEFPEWEDDND